MPLSLAKEVLSLLLLKPDTLLYNPKLLTLDLPSRHLVVCLPPPLAIAAHPCPSHHLSRQPTPSLPSPSTSTTRLLLVPSPSSLPLAIPLVIASSYRFGNPAHVLGSERKTFAPANSTPTPLLDL